MVEEVLLDTDALIELHKDEKVLKAAHISYDMGISVVTLYEYLFGLAYIGKDVERWKEVLDSLYEVVPLDQGIIKRALLLDVKLSKRGLRLEFRDLIVGASALERGLPLVTGNVKHFERLEEEGLALVELRGFLNRLRSL